ncbi:MAG TPA: MBL fold metallo-hydrolase [Bryobacteraceae bacterium]|nr:MBL fold metallo-hydrolase [Bryobacteraceae bacterium]
MDRIPIPEYDAAPLDNIAVGVAGTRLLFVNVFAVETTNGWSLVDAGLPFSASRIRGWVEEQFGGKAHPKSIVLTHGHFDHTGAIEDLLEHWDVPVYAHPLEAPYLTGKARYPPPDASAGGGLMSVLSPLYPRGPVDISRNLRPLPEDGSLPEMPGWEWIHTPGHTRGHISLFRDADHVLLVGDAFCTTKAESFLAVATGRPELHGPPAYYTSDWDDARRSVEKLAALEPRVLAPGHGMPMAGTEIPALVHRLADEFASIALPQT